MPNLNPYSLCLLAVIHAEITPHINNAPSIFALYFILTPNIPNVNKFATFREMANPLSVRKLYQTLLLSVRLGLVELLLTLTN